MATIDHQAWLDALKQVQASTNAYGFDPSWFAQDQLAQTSGDRLEQMKRDYLAQNPGARDWSPEIKDAIASLRPDTFGGLVMTPEGAKAYDDLVTKKDKREQWQSVLTTAGLAALPFAAASFMAPAAGAAGGGVSSLAGIAPELTAPCPLPVVTSQPPKSPWAAFLALRLLEALGRLARVVSERSAGWGLRPRHFLAVLPRS